MKTILIVDDDPAILRGLEAALTEDHYHILSAADGERGFAMAKRENIDLILLDIMLPKKNGMDICRDLRKDGVETPILILTSKKEETDTVLGLELGADDYMAKPFSVRELRSRVKAILRRTRAAERTIEEYSFGDVEVDFRKQEATRGNRAVQLSSREFKILQLLIRHEGEVVSRDTLLGEVWGYEHFPTTRTVDNFILSLRKKLEKNPARPQHLITVYTSGYKFVK